MWRNHLDQKVGGEAQPDSEGRKQELRQVKAIRAEFGGRAFVAWAVLVRGELALHAGEPQLDALLVVGEPCR
jgi:hypothetical protein